MRPNKPLPAGYGRDAVSLRVGRVPKAAVAKDEFSRVRTELNRASGLRQDARTWSSFGLAVDHGRKGVFFMLSMKPSETLFTYKKKNIKTNTYDLLDVCLTTSKVPH